MENILAFDFGGTHIKYGLINQHAHILNQEHTSTPNSLDDLIVLIQDQLRKNTNKKITGIAVSSPGSVADNGVIYGSSAIPYLHGPNIKKLIESRVGLTVHIENDANCAALAEIWQGSAVGKENIAVVVIGTGIGGALVRNGIIEKGSHLHGGEFGYMILDQNNLGSGMNTFSELASTYSIIKRVAERKGVPSSSLKGEMMFSKSEQGDRICQQAIAEFYHMLAIGMYNIQYTYDPESILIGGGISVREDLLERLTKEMEAIISLVDVATVIPKVEKCYFKANANLIGAAYHYRQAEGLGSTN